MRDYSRVERLRECLARYNIPIVSPNGEYRKLYDVLEDNSTMLDMNIKSKYYIAEEFVDVGSRYVDAFDSDHNDNIEPASEEEIERFLVSD